MINTLSWGRFQNHVAPRIHTLYLDFTAIPRSTIDFVVKSSTLPPKFSLPCLHVYHVIVTEAYSTDFQIARCFMVGSVTDFAFEVRQNQLGALNQDPLIHYRDGRTAPPRGVTGATNNRPLAPLDLYKTILLDMPLISRISIHAQDRKLFDPSSSLGAHTLLRLQHLRAVTLSAYALSSPVVAVLARHPSLREIHAFGADHHWCEETMPLTVGSPVDVLESIPASDALSELTVCIAPFSLQLVRAVNLINLTSLTIIVPHQYLLQGPFIVELFDAIGANFKNLRTLRVCLLGRMNAKLTYEALAPLRQLTDLEVLDIEGSTTIAVHEDELAALVTCWPQLLHLALDDGRLEHFEYNELPPLTLGGILAIVTKHCPRLKSLSAYVSPSVAGYAAPGQLPTAQTRLHALGLRFGHSPDPCSLSSPADVAQVVYAACADECGVKLRDILDLDAAPVGGATNRQVSAARERKAAMRSMRRCIAACRDEWVSLGARDGKKPQERYFKQLKDNAECFVSS